MVWCIYIYRKENLCLSIYLKAYLFIYIYMYAIYTGGCNTTNILLYYYIIYNYIYNIRNFVSFHSSTKYICVYYILCDSISR